MFENLLENLKEKFQQNQQKKQQEKEELARMQLEVDFEKKRIFQEEFRKNALEVAKAQAKKEAAEKSGIQKMRAQNRLRNLNKNQTAPGSAFGKFAEYTQKNLARREENMKRTQEMREEARKTREEKIGQRTKPFNKSW
ncbi:hypothetical protein LCGC14_0476470 [marine sediment metagenome]|uniref:Uncharacterized protein n=1 Tax=marine sediment metagenome TaxID=412755 RepID=A0A0F9SFX4_9ZZZZ